MNGKNNWTSRLTDVDVIYCPATNGLTTSDEPVCRGCGAPLTGVSDGRHWGYREPGRGRTHGVHIPFLRAAALGAAAALLVTLLAGLMGCGGARTPATASKAVTSAPPIVVFSWREMQFGEDLYVLVEVPVFEASGLVARAEAGDDPRIVRDAIASGDGPTTSLLLAMPDTTDVWRPPEVWLESPDGRRSQPLPLSFIEPVQRAGRNVPQPST